MAGVGMSVVEWFATYVMEKLVDFASSRLADPHRDVFSVVDEKLKEMEGRLPRIHAAIHAAEGRPIRDPALASWMRQLKDAAFEADDLLDELDYRQLEARVQDRSKVSAFASSSLRFLKNLFVSDDELRRLKNILGDLDKISLEINQRKAELEEYNHARQQNRETSSFSTQEVVFGRDKERDLILEILLSAGDGPDYDDTKRAGSSRHLANLDVLPILGIGGVGKTTLAQLVYSDQRVAQHFELRKWVYVSDNFDVKRIAMELETNVTSDAHPFRDSSLDAQLSKLRDATANKRYLFVLDDVWDEIESSWAKLRSALTFGSKGSTILITTQSPLVAEIMGTVKPIKLELLEEDDYWRLFEHCSLGDKEIDLDLRRKLELLGQQIAKKMHGLPLAAKTVGSMLRCRLEEQYWKAIQESEWWEHDFVVDNILPSLGLSYQHLSSNYKQCFAYTSIFPKGHMFNKERLVQMWIAQGFIQEKTLRGRMTLEDIGSQIFDELTSRYFFMRTVNDRYVMHDLIRELAVCVSIDECLVLHDEHVKIPATVCHLTLRVVKMNALPELRKLQKLRTLIFYPEYDSEFLLLPRDGSKEFFKFLEGLLEDMKSLRVIDLSQDRSGINKLPDAICDLPHLRFLDVSWTKIKQLPKGFPKLYHLQVLNLKRRGTFSILPQGMNRLIKLRHLYADANTISLIHGIGKLTELQELEEFHVSNKRGRQIEELKDLRYLRRRLTIQDIQNVESKEEAVGANLDDKENLHELMLNRKPDIRSQGDKEKEILDGLQPHHNLKSLEIHHYGGMKSPSWLENNQITNLEFVYLNKCARWDTLPPLGKLPFLKNLVFKMMPSIRRIGREFFGDGDTVFPSLEKLIFDQLNEWEEWSGTDKKSVFPRLFEINIINCVKLRQIPLLPLRSMSVLKIWNCGDIGTTLPQYLLHLTSLVDLSLENYPHRVSVCLSNLTALKNLELQNCPELILLGGFQSLGNLKLLKVTKCPKLNESSQPLEEPYVEEGLRSLSYIITDESIINHVWVIVGRAQAVKSLILANCEHLKHFKPELEEWFQQLTSLQELQFVSCPDLQRLPANLETVFSIRRLIITHCPSIDSLPENGLPISLKELKIYGCRKLKDRCQKDDGPDWPKIAMIPHIVIEGEVISGAEEAA
ncbi:putative disease resistance protein RGA1 [Zingiber officinale]|uniref:Disease resistance protein RGA3 n=1 Tax=Zingiber officinale TaxID=94328 RepID=A0A8J5HKG1_ZINOF|nr:putative disease resistance protein RGA1 [Zingiber officinale]KAG6526856.1 hypothetical protein ZIOFF_016859 [Zingiber officinale]